jgi:hypothetical protein
MNGILFKMAEATDTVQKHMFALTQDNHDGLLYIWCLQRVPG